MKTLKCFLALIAILLLNSTFEAFGTAFTVTNNSDAAAGSLRAIITALNADLTSTAVAPHTVVFTGGPYTITLSSSLPTITRHCSINGGVLGSIVLDMANGLTGYGFQFTGATIDNSTVKNMVINNSGTGPHIWVNAAAGIHVTITNNRIGTNAAGTGSGPRNPDVGDAIKIEGGCSGNSITNNLLSGISGGGYGILLDNSSNNTITGNLIGTDVTGNTGGANFTIFGGILLRNGCTSTTISNNTIANIGTSCIEINGSSSNTVSSNKLGTNSTGLIGGAAFHFNDYGVFMNNGGNSNTVDNNLVSNGNSGIFMWSSNNNIVKRNLVGTDATGNVGGANFAYTWDNIQIDGGSVGNLIGGLVATDGNVVCNSLQAGISVKGGNTKHNHVLNNQVGLAKNGVTLLGNQNYGIYVGWGAVSNSIGAITAGGTVYGNIVTNTYKVAAGFGQGIEVEEASTFSNSIRGNSVYCNTPNYGGIGFFNAPQSGVVTPTISATSTTSNVNGSGLTLGDTVDLYYTDACNACVNPTGKTWIGRTVVIAGGTWSYTGGVVAASTVTVTVTQKSATSDYGNTSQFSPCSIPIPLPVQLISFTATNSSQGVVLDWATAIELNNDHFTIQRSTDGIHFETIGTVDGHGTTSSVNNYSFIDNTALTGNVYYQLVQVDFNAQSTSSPIVSVSIKENDLFYVYPSPTSIGNTINLVVSDESNNQHSITIIDALGQTIVSRTDNEHTYSISTENFAKGMYTVVLYKNNKAPQLVKFTLE